MKKILLLFILFISLHTSHAQWGLTVGVNASKFIGEGYSNLATINGGITKGFGSGHFRLQTALLFSPKGTHVNYDKNEASVHLNYIEVPINFSYGLGIGKISRISIDVGPFMGIAINGYSKLNGEKIKLDMSKDIERLEFGLNGSLNFKIHKIKISIAYNRGLTGIVKGQVLQSTIQQHSSLNLTYIL